jgi:hypothetical protein
VGGGVQLGPLGTAATIMRALGDYDAGEIGGMIGRGNRSNRRKPAPVPLCPPQTPHAARTRTRSTAVGSQRLAAWSTARPCRFSNVVTALLSASCIGTWGCDRERGYVLYGTWQFRELEWYSSTNVLLKAWFDASRREDSDCDDLGVLDFSGLETALLLRLGPMLPQHHYTGSLCWPGK